MEKSRPVRKEDEADELYEWMKKEEELYERIAEWIGSGCCEDDLWSEDGRNCRSCEWFEDCGEGHELVKMSSAKEE